MEKKRCNWASNSPDFYKKYHDEEWGKEVHDDNLLFELIVLEGAQAGLSWSTILKRRENYRLAFDDFDYNKIAKYDEKKIIELLNNEGIIRNKLKINSAINNAKQFLKIQKEFGSFDKYIWGFVDYKPIINGFESMKEIPAKTELSDKISKDMKKRGFNFIGSTIIYAYLQSIGIVNDHLVSCFRYQELIG